MANEIYDVSPDVLLRHSRKGPRYTSYPTAPIWTEDHPQSAMDAALSRVASPASVYVHVPFCKEQCTFCGCNMVVAGRREPGDRYLDAMERQIVGLNLPSARIPVQRIHLGGGTPTWLDEAQLERLFKMLYTRFSPIEGAELSVEADPEVTTDGQVHLMAELGVNRLSMGVQSFDPKVLEAVNRPQEHTRVHAIMDLSRSLGMGSMNLDLIYGLPFQTAASFADTLHKTLVMRPDRLAIFGYAHVPWLKPHMKRMNVGALPNPLERVALFLLAHRLLTEAGYEAIGMDHFALPDDELTVARHAEALHRNFMGYTTLPDVEMIGLGMSAISEFKDSYVQQKLKLSQWWTAVESDTSPIEKGFTVSAEDLLRRDVINRLMCNLVVPFDVIEQTHGVDFHSHFADAMAEMGQLQDQGLVEISDKELRVTSTGTLLVRNVAMPFDAYLKQPSDGPRYSQTV